jgi:YD repeat-containing protein
MRNSAFAIFLLALSTPALAQESVTYEYDALGRLVTSKVTGGSNDQVQTSIAYDAAGNRTSYAVANASTGPGPGTPAKPKLIVVPLNGFTIIPIK